MKREGVKAGGSTSTGSVIPETGGESLHAANPHGPQRQKKTHCLGQALACVQVTVESIYPDPFSGQVLCFQKGIKIMPLKKSLWLVTIFYFLYFIMYKVEGEAIQNSY